MREIMDQDGMPVKSSSQPHTCSLFTSVYFFSSYYIHIYLQSDIIFSGFPATVFIFFWFHACHISCPSHFSSFARPSNITWRVQIMKSVTAYISHCLSCALVTSSILLSILISNNLSFQFPLTWEIMFNTHTEHRSNYNSEYFNLYIFKLWPRR